MLEIEQIWLVCIGRSGERNQECFTSKLVPAAQESVFKKKNNNNEWMYINYKTPFSNFHSSKSQPQGFTGSPVAKILGSQCREHGLSPGQGTKIPHATTGIWK